MELCIDAAQLRKALADIEAAEVNGFAHCLAVLRFVSAGQTISDNRVEYSDLLERANPTDGRYNWGRFQRVSVRHKFANGKLVPISAATPTAPTKGE